MTDPANVRDSLIALVERALKKDGLLEPTPLSQDPKRPDVSALVLVERSKEQNHSYLVEISRA